LSAPTRLAIYNQALRICDERRLASLSEDRKPRYLLDQVWTDENGVASCLEEGQWNFAMRAVQIDYDTAVSPAFGLAYGFTKPSDWVRTSGVCSDERFEVPYRLYKEEAGYWYADITPLYVRYVSSDANFGGDLSNWPATFTQYVATYFASQIIFNLTADKEKIGAIHALLKKVKRDALNKDAMNDATGMPFRGSWSRSRAGGRTPWRDGGNRGSLIG
jgi:hypothetical protein